MRFFKILNALLFFYAASAFAQSELAKPRSNQNFSGGTDARGMAGIPPRDQCFPQIQSWVDHDRKAHQIGEIINNLWQAARSVGSDRALQSNSAESCDQQYPVLNSSGMNLRERHATLWRSELGPNLHSNIRRCERQNSKEDRDLVDRYYFGHLQIEQYSQVIIDQLAAADAHIISNDPILLGRNCNEFIANPQLKKKCETYASCPRNSEADLKAFYQEGASEYELFLDVERKMQQAQRDRQARRGPLKEGAELSKKIQFYRELRDLLLVQHPYFAGAKFKEEMSRSFRPGLTVEEKEKVFASAFQRQNQENRRLLNLELMKMEKLRECLENSSNIRAGCEDRDQINKDLLSASERSDWKNRIQSQGRRPDRDLQRGLERQQCLIANAVDRKEKQDVAGELALNLALIASPIGLSSLAVRSTAAAASRLSALSAVAELGGAAYYTVDAVRIAGTSCADERTQLQRVIDQPNTNTQNACPGLKNKITQAVNDIDNCVLNTMLAGAEALGFGVAVDVARNIKRANVVSNANAEARAARTESQNATLIPSPAYLEYRRSIEKPEAATAVPNTRSNRSPRLSQEQLNANARLTPEEKARALGLTDPKHIEAIRRVESGALGRVEVSNKPLSMRSVEDQIKLSQKRNILREAGVPPEVIRRCMREGYCGAPQVEVPKGSLRGDAKDPLTLELPRGQRILDSSSPPPKAQLSSEEIQARLQRARAEKDSFDYRSEVEPQLGEIGSAFSGKKGDPKILENGFVGARNEGVEIVQGPERPLFVKISTFTESNANKSFNNEVFFTKLMSDLGRGPEFHGVFSRKARPNEVEYVAPENLRIMTDAVPGDNFQLAATTAETVRKFSFNDIDAIEKEAFSLVDDLKIAPADFQVRVARTPSGEPKIYVVDPASFWFIKGSDAHIKAVLTQGFQEMRAIKIVTEIDDGLHNRLPQNDYQSLRLSLEKMEPERFKQVVEEFKKTPRSEWENFVRRYKAQSVP